MRIAYFDCFSGASGDMIMGALLDAGAHEDELRAGLEELSLPGYVLRTQRVVKEGISATHASVALQQTDEGHGRHLSDIARIISASRLDPAVSEQALCVFQRLAEAEAHIHGVSPDDIHFHEVGAVDAIVDIVGGCLALRSLRVERVYVSPLPMARGWIRCAHGDVPSPAPAALELLQGFTLHQDERTWELVTPTGAALLAQWAERNPDGSAAQPPDMTLLSVGYGAGTRDFERPNVLRVVIGETP